jgi:molybdenum-dependent DNA-binding transcriptional regulator ModE
MAVRKNLDRQDPADFTIEGRLSGPGFRRLMRLVSQLGSVRAAALEMGLSGQTAWRYATGRTTAPN